jgi:16S rRNA (guanine(966)-N(2))-methyltransferase RsmD
MDLRPTTAKAKQGLFNILNNRVQWENCIALDLFSGTGSLTYELASRGCKQVTSVDISPQNCGYIRASAKQLNLNNVIIVRSDSLSFIRSHKEPYDIIIADPPYDYPHYPILPQLIFEKGLLKKGGILVIEHSKRVSLKDNPHFTDQRGYGEVNFSFFELQPSENA